MTAVGWLSLVGMLVLIGIAIWLTGPLLATAVQAHRDYRRARGTLHRAEIERSLPRLEQRVAEGRAVLTRIDRDVRDLCHAEEVELDRSLADHLVRTRLDDVPGVGRSRVEAIQAKVFRGQVRDLLHAENVPGIGPQTAAAIASWVARMEADWPKLRTGAFPGKDEIAGRYAHRRAAAEQDRKTASHQLDELEGVATAVSQELGRLRRITPGVFRRSLRSPGTPNGVDLQAYLLGVFPPWDSPPRWYTAMIGVDSDERKG